MASAIGTVQTAQRLGPALGPVIGGVVAQLVGLRNAFLVTAGFYVVALVLVFFMYDERTRPHEPRSPTRERAAITFRNVLAFENFVLLMAVIFGLQFVDRSFGPVLPLYVERARHADATACRWSPDVLFSVAAGAGAVGHHLCARLLRTRPARTVIALRRRSPAHAVRRCSRSQPATGC